MEIEKLLDGVKLEIVTGDGLIAIKDAAKLSRIHPVALEMGQKLLDGKAAAKFHLASKEMRENAAVIKKLLLTGLRRVAAYLGDGSLTPKAVLQGDTLSFYYEKKGGPRLSRRGAKHG